MFNKLTIIKNCIVLLPRKRVEFKRSLQSKSSQVITEAACADQNHVENTTNPFAVNKKIKANMLENEKENLQSFLSATNTDEKPATLAISPEEKERRLKVLQLEAEVARQEGKRVPTLDYLKDHHWDQIIAMPSRSARMKFYSYLCKNAAIAETRKMKKQEKAASAQDRIDAIRKERAENPHIVYGLGNVSMFLRVYDATINHWMNHRLIRAMLFSPKIVLDCSYDNQMDKREAENAAKQLMLCFAENRAHDDPFDLHYCNVDLDSTCMKRLQSYIPTMLNPEFPMNIHSECFTEIFSKNNIVYLTPHCQTDLETYNSDDVYVIGAMVDKRHAEPLSLAKAKRLGLRVARLPLDRYLQWGSGSGKSLTLNQMVNILLDLKKTGDWETSLKHVPRRKVIDSEERLASFYAKQKNRVNVRVDKIFDNGNGVFKPVNSVRSHKKHLKFNLANWGSKK
uniref:RNA (guanine-9-)-methyltransferase domain-containing protein 1 n=1 Tax=Glossina palpalis gambiensis TaxID=67801 RepID=A0A1B0AML1_9MUSC